MSGMNNRHILQKQKIYLHFVLSTHLKDVAILLSRGNISDGIAGPQKFRKQTKQEHLRDKNYCRKNMFEQKSLILKRLFLMR